MARREKKKQFDLISAFNTLFFLRSHSYCFASFLFFSSLTQMLNEEKMKRN